jgi:hypothetical protein
LYFEGVALRPSTASKAWDCEKIATQFSHAAVEPSVGMDAENGDRGAKDRDQGSEVSDQKSKYLQEIGAGMETFAGL